MNYVELLLNRVTPMIELDNVPADIDGDFVKRELLVNGRVGVTDTTADGKKLNTPQAWRGYCGGAVNKNYLGSRFIGCSPALGSCDFEIGKEGAVIFNSTAEKFSLWSNSSIVIGTKNRRSTDPILLNDGDTVPNSILYQFIERTAEQLLNIDISMRSILRTVRAMIFIVAKNEQVKNAAEILLHKLYAGDTDIVFTSDILDSLQIQFAPTAANAASILAELKEQYQFANAQFFHAIGVNSNYNLKRERLNSAEIDLNEQALNVNIKDIFASWEKGFSEVAALFPSFDIKPRLSDVWRQNTPDEQPEETDSTNENGDGEKNDNEVKDVE